MNSKTLVNIFNIDKPNICFVGDIHGEFNSLQGLMKKTISAGQRNSKKQGVMSSMVWQV